MATHHPILFEREESGTYSAYVAGLPVYAQGATRGKRRRRSCERSARIWRPIPTSSRARRCGWRRSPFRRGAGRAPGSTW